MKIKIQYVYGDLEVFDFDENNPLSALKELIAEKNSVHPDQIRLMKNGDVLKKKNKTSDYDITEEDTIICLINKDLSVSEEKQSNDESEVSDEKNTDLPEGSVGSIFDNFFSNLMRSSQTGTVMTNLMENINLPEESEIRSSIENMYNDNSTNIHTMEFTYSNVNDDNATVQFKYNSSDDPNNVINESYLIEADSDDETGINMSDGSNATTTTTENTNNETNELSELKTKWKDELEEIKNMGFSDTEEVLKTLLLSNGSVPITVNKLLEKGN